MTRITPFSNPLLLGFETMEKTLDRLTKAGEGYPPYNIERLSEKDKNDRLRITLAVAGFTPEELEVTIEDNQLVIRGRHADMTRGDITDPEITSAANFERVFLYRGIASRQFQRIFVLADGMRVLKADLKNGLLSIDLERPTPEKSIKRINITALDE